MSTTPNTMPAAWCAARLAEVRAHVNLQDEAWEDLSHADAYAAHYAGTAMRGHADMVRALALAIRSQRTMLIQLLSQIDNPPAPELSLRHLVDTVWQHIHDDQSVPSTAVADNLILLAKQTQPR